MAAATTAQPASTATLPGTATADANPDPQKANFRQRPLLLVDEVVTPLMGNCALFARYVEKAALELAMCVETVDKLARLWA